MGRNNKVITTNDIYLKYSSSTIKNFDKPENSNAFKFHEIKELLNGKEKNCFFKKKTDEEFLVIVPMEEKGGQVEFVVEYSEFLFEIKVKNRKKSRFNNEILIPDLKYAFERLCTLHFVEDKEKYSLSPSDLLTNEDLSKEVLTLEVAPIEYQKEIWETYIDAQEVIIKDLEESYGCKGYNKDDKKFKVELNVDNNSEYVEFENELKNQFQIETNFDADGSIQLKYDDITRGLDLIIRKKFDKKLEREKRIGCILTIRPFLKECIKRKYVSKSFHVEQNNNSLTIKQSKDL